MPRSSSGLRAAPSSLAPGDRASYIRCSSVEYHGFSWGRAVGCSRWSDRTLRVWDAAKGRLLATLEGHDRSVVALAVLPDGRVVSGSIDDTLRVWDVDTGRTLATVYGDTSFVSVACVDQRRIIAGDDLGNVWFLELPDLPTA